ncbi:diguanylate cyclase [Shewanella sp. JM162201]|uniref:Diguanylate cyclase n=1 Tax=Shewanella jiangmenensis TaxID=2837387 RepID=A0ABS5UYH5_9GAMM|nr:diguanylate cyclase [Shewanella jiangmenensis]MBT1443167.1 diguanylate cyclase [Shewanella jiangmenensis]
MIYSFRNSGFRDPETGVYNHTYFMEVFNREWHRHIRDKQSLALLYLYPHLQETTKKAGMLELLTKDVEGALLRSTDMMGRLNQECFAMGLFNIDDAGTEVVVERIKAQIAEFLAKYGKDASLRMDYRIAACICLPTKDRKPETLFMNTETMVRLMDSTSENSAIERLQ